MLARKHLAKGFMLLLAVWLVVLFLLVSYFQDQYVKAFTHNSSEFLNADFSEQWLNQLTPLLPTKNTQLRIIQLWVPGCLCNRFARPHAAQTVAMAKQKGIEHITLIPKEYESQLAKLQQLNPDSQIMTIPRNALASWPNSPSTILQGPLEQLLYFGPLGYGAFCSQPNTSELATQIRAAENNQFRPFFNVIGQGCFCPFE